MLDDLANSGMLLTSLLISLLISVLISLLDALSQHRADFLVVYQFLEAPNTGVDGGVFLGQAEERS